MTQLINGRSGRGRLRLEKNESWGAGKGEVEEGCNKERSEGGKKGMLRNI